MWQLRVGSLLVLFERKVATPPGQIAPPLDQWGPDPGGQASSGGAGSYPGAHNARFGGGRPARCAAAHARFGGTHCESMPPSGPPPAPTSSWGCDWRLRAGRGNKRCSFRRRGPWNRGHRIVEAPPGGWDCLHRWRKGQKVHHGGVRPDGLQGC